VEHPDNLNTYHFLSDEQIDAIKQKERDRCAIECEKEAMTWSHNLMHAHASAAAQLAMKIRSM